MATTLITTSRTTLSGYVAGVTGKNIGKESVKLYVFNLLHLAAKIEFTREGQTYKSQAPIPPGLTIPGCPLYIAVVSSWPATVGGARASERSRTR